jgi:SAM-dependent methyltransferase
LLITYHARDNCWDARLERESLPEFAIQWRLWSEGRFGDTHLLYGKNAQDDFADLLKTLDLTTDDVAGRKLLEVGFGHGRILKEFQRITETAVGLDLAKPLLDVGLAQRSIVCGDLFAIPFQPGQFDIVVCRGVIMCTRDAERAFSKVAEQVGVGGLLYVYVYEPMMPRSLVFRVCFQVSGISQSPLASRSRGP